MGMRRSFHRLSYFSRLLFRRRKLDQELNDEIAYHVEAKTEENIAKGLTPEEARRAARIELGSAEQVKERVRAARVGMWLEVLVQDIRFGLRMLRKSLGFTTVAILTLALGIGANTGIFSVVYGVALAPLPYRDADRLVLLWETIARGKYLQTDSYQNFRDWQKEARSFQEMAAWRPAAHDLSGPGTPEHIAAAEVSSNFFATLGVRPFLGRDFAAEEDRVGGTPVALISNRLWKTRFDSSTDALGKPVTLDGVDYTIVGVLPPKFRFLDQADVYTPLGESDAASVFSRADHAGIVVIARLKAGPDISQAQAEMDTVQNHLDGLYPDANRGLGVKLHSLKHEIVGNVDRTLLLLLGAVGLVLLIACANVASLLLARSSVRTREFAIRSALGATRARVTRQLLTESTLLSVAGGALGLLIATFGIKPMLAALPGTLPRAGNISVNSWVLLFTLAVSIVVGMLFGLAPALKSSAPDLELRLKEGSRLPSGAHQRALSSLVIFQMAVTLVLLVSCGLLFRTIIKLWNVNPGFDAACVITLKVGLSPSVTNTASAARTAYEQLLQRVRAIPGVEAASLTLLVPLEHMDVEAHFWLGTQKPAYLQEAPYTLQFLTGPDCLRTMGIPLLQGRFFTAEDTMKSTPVIVIDSVFARTYFAGSNPIGRTITFDPIDRPCRIIGVVGHVRHWGLANLSTYTRAQSYFSLFQVYDQATPVILRRATLVVRTSLGASDLIAAIRKAAYGAGRGEPIYDVQTMQQIVADSMSPQRLPMILLAAFAALALALAAIGIYGVTSYSVAQRVSEIGIRLALGAQPHNVLRDVLGRGARMALSGIAVGVAASLFLMRLMKSLLFGVSPTDPLTFAAVVVVLLGVALLGCYIPARRAMRVDPMVALKYE
jgi:putative ABC transport system permease protein